MSKYYLRIIFFWFSSGSGDDQRGANLTPSVRPVARSAGSRGDCHRIWTVRVAELNYSMLSIVYYVQFHEYWRSLRNEKNEKNPFQLLTILTVSHPHTGSRLICLGVAWPRANCKCYNNNNNNNPHIYNNNNNNNNNNIITMTIIIRMSLWLWGGVERDLQQDGNKGCYWSNSIFPGADTLL